MNATGAAFGLAGTLFTGMVVLVGYVLTRGKTDAEAGNQQAQAWGTFSDKQSAWMDRLDKRITDLEADVQHEREQRRLSNDYARTLVDALRAGGLTVPPVPSGLDLD